MRRVGAHKVITESETLTQAVVEIYDDRVVNYYEFRDELPMTEWLGGTITVKRDDEGILRASKDGKVIIEL